VPCACAYVRAWLVCVLKLKTAVASHQKMCGLMTKHSHGGNGETGRGHKEKRWGQLIRCRGLPPSLCCPRLQATAPQRGCGSAAPRLYAAAHPCVPDGYTSCIKPRFPICIAKPVNGYTSNPGRHYGLLFCLAPLHHELCPGHPIPMGSVWAASRAFTLLGPSMHHKQTRQCPALHKRPAPQVASKADLVPALLHALHSASPVVCVGALELMEALLGHVRCGQVRQPQGLMGPWGRVRGSRLEIFAGGVQTGRQVPLAARALLCSHLRYK